MWTHPKESKKDDTGEEEVVEWSGIREGKRDTGKSHGEKGKSPKTIQRTINFQREMKVLGGRGTVQVTPWGGFWVFQKKCPKILVNKIPWNPASKNIIKSAKFGGEVGGNECQGKRKHHKKHQ